jgi:hypothetical protein
MFDEIEAEHRELMKSMVGTHKSIVRTVFLLLFIGPPVTLAFGVGVVYCAFKLVEIQRVKAVAPPQVQVEMPAGDLHE